MIYSELVSLFRAGNIRIDSASYIGNPVDFTIMFISKKVNVLIVNLEGHKGCIVFAETGIDLSALSNVTLKDNVIIEDDNPQYLYAKFANVIADKRREEERERHYTLTEGGYYVGENTKIGDGTTIEPGCLIGHDVVIGANSQILYGAVIKNAIIGNNAIINEYAVIGSYGFTMALDENGNKFRIPTLGKVVIGDNVEIGAHDNISCGSGGNTVIEDYSKIDALVHLGHDVHFARNVEVTAGGIIGGFVDAADGAYVGINAVLRNRIKIGQNAIIGMGSTVTKSVDANITVAGNPARPFVKDGGKQ